MLDGMAAWRSLASSSGSVRGGLDDRKNHPYPWWANDQRHDFTRHLATALAVPVLTSTGTDHGGSECYTSFPLRFVEPATD